MPHDYNRILDALEDAADRAWAAETERQDQESIMADNADSPRERLARAWEQAAGAYPCECLPYRGGTTHARHFPFCGWDRFTEGFLAAAEAFGVTLDDLPVLALSKGKE